MKLATRFHTTRFGIDGAILPLLHMHSDSLKFLGLELDKFLNWKNHIDKLLSKLSCACFAIRSMSFHCNITTIKMIYFAYFHSLLEYGIAFWGNSTESVKCNVILFLQ